MTPRIKGVLKEKGGPTWNKRGGDDELAGDFMF